MDETTRLIWLDLETTGLDARHETILEIAAFTTTLDKPFVLTPLYEAVIHADPVVKAGVEPHVRGMHTANGLWEACERSPIPLRDVDLNLSQMIGAPDHSAVLAGSSVHFDHDFIRVHMPLTALRLSHRHYDVSAIKLFAQSLGMEKFKKAEAHRAAADVLESVAHAKAVAEWLATSDWGFETS